MRTIAYMSAARVHEDALLGAPTAAGPATKPKVNKASTKKPTSTTDQAALPLETTPSSPAKKARRRSAP